MAYRKVRIVLGLVAQNPTTKDLVVPSAAQVYLSNKTTVATIYSDTTGTALTNSPGVPTGVTVGTPGLDVYGNLVFYGDVGVDYYALVNSVFVPLPVTGIHGTDFTEHTDGTVPDPHGTRAWALAEFISQGDTTTLTGALGNAGLVRF
jgi:hypothetical protein